MTALSPALGHPPSEDPDLPTGKALVAEQRTRTAVYTAKLGIIWAGLMVFLTVVLLQLNFDPTYAFAHYGFVLEGLWTTVWISLASIFFATLLALLGAVGRLSKNSIAQGIAGFYVSVFRGTPLLIQIYIIYNGLPQVGQHLIAVGQPAFGKLFIMDAASAGILALSLNYGAYMTEIFRAGIQSISHGQREAAQALGMNGWQMMRRIILPQAVRVIIPDIGNQFIAMQKDSAQVSVMGIWEMTFRANRFARQDSKFMEMFLIAAIFYWLLTIVSSWAVGYLEKRMATAYER